MFFSGWRYRFSIFEISELTIEIKTASTVHEAVCDSNRVHLLSVCIDEYFIINSKHISILGISWTPKMITAKKVNISSCSITEPHQSSIRTFLITSYLNKSIGTMFYEPISFVKLLFNLVGIINLFFFDCFERGLTLWFRLHSAFEGFEPINITLIILHIDTAMLGFIDCDKFFKVLNCFVKQILIPLTPLNGSLLFNRLVISNMNGTL